MKFLQFACHAKTITRLNGIKFLNKYIGTVGGSDSVRSPESGVQSPESSVQSPESGRMAGKGTAQGLNGYSAQKECKQSDCQSNLEMILIEYRKKPDKIIDNIFDYNRKLIDLNKIKF